ncbi:histidine phosphatase family protein [Algiphilus sp.]|uniref:histidine phosphatase family protein n=1 Tax=Algiphilus sp. TaxID=1872431 RepID=UPI003C35A5CA
MGAVYLIRHGQASFGKADYDQLSDTGMRQASRLGEALSLRLPHPDVVVCGGMLRHQQTAAKALAAMGLPPEWETDTRWNEFDHDEIIRVYEPRYANHAVLTADLARTLKPRRAFQDMFAKAVGRWIDGAHDDDYVEAWPTFCTRVKNASDELCGRLGRGRSAFVFTSGGVITSLAADLMKLGTRETMRLNWTIANASVSKLIFSDRGVYLSTLNEHAHFEGEHRELITYR